MFAYVFIITFNKIRLSVYIRFTDKFYLFLEKYIYSEFLITYSIIRISIDLTMAYTRTNKALG